MIYNVGSINIDYVYRVPHLVKPGETLASETLVRVLGGKGANQSVALAQAGAQVSHVGQLGENDLWALTQLSEFGVNVDNVATIDEPSGHAIIQVDDSGENSIVLFGGANQQLTPAQLNQAFKTAATGDWVLIQNECNELAEVFKIAAANELPLVFNPAPMSASVLELPLENAHCLILNEVEANFLAGAGVNGGGSDVASLVRALIERFPKTIVALTMGAQGAMLIENREITSFASPTVNAVDTTGAGDTFVGYFLASLDAGRSLEDAANIACHAAAMSVTAEGATPSIPAQADVLKFMNTVTV